MSQEDRLFIRAQVAFIGAFTSMYAKDYIMAIVFFVATVVFNRLASHYDD